MDVSFVSILLFILTLVLYFMYGKPALVIPSPDTNADTWPDTVRNYEKQVMSSLWLFVGATIVGQWILNVTYTTATCGFNGGRNLIPSTLFTLFPWTLIFGVLVGALIAYPSLKAVFSNVIGYFAISSDANQLLGSLFTDTGIQSNLDEITSAADKNAMARSAEAIIKICGNKGLLINQFSIANFMETWDALSPLMNANATHDVKQKMLDLVVHKENVGEAVWYVYSAIFVSSIVYYNIASRGCVKDLATIKREHDEYIDQHEAAATQLKETTTTYYAS